ncbi:hypothetical protein EON65_17650 [archaeon]|nr:MAG: hypothetical protein EON65_17650 [archaeon]
MLKNPLYKATELVERELLTCPDKLTNETQLRPLLALSAYPFYVLEVLQDGEKGGFVMKEQEVPSTPQKKPVKRARKNMESVECEVSPLKKDIRALRFD